MTRVKQLLILVVGGALTIFMVFLGLWQMQVFQSQAEGSAEARANAPAKDLESNLVKGRVGDLYARQVSATGTFLPEHQVLAGVEYPMKVVTAFRTKQGSTVTVVRGTVERGQSVPAPPKGETTVTGVILPSQNRLQEPLPSGAPEGSITAVRLELLAQTWPAPILDGFITLRPEASQAQGLGASAPEIPDVGGGKTRNRGYAMQWWAFAAFGAVATGVAVRSAGKSDVTLAR